MFGLSSGEHLGRVEGETRLWNPFRVAWCEGVSTLAAISLENNTSRLRLLHADNPQLLQCKKPVQVTTVPARPDSSEVTEMRHTELNWKGTEYETQILL